MPTINIYLSASAAERIATDRNSSVYGWDFKVTAQQERKVEYDQPSEGDIFIREVKVAIPDIEACTASALAGLDRQEREVYIRTEEALSTIRTRRNNLLALTYSPANASSPAEGSL